MNSGGPLLLTLNEIRFVPVCPGVGVQVKSPVQGFIIAPAGGFPIRAKVNT